MSWRWEYWLLLALATLFVGYLVGRRQGKGEGFDEGVRYAPLEMRRQTWEKGVCVICGSRAARSGPPAAAKTAARPDEPTESEPLAREGEDAQAGRGEEP